MSTVAKREVKVRKEGVFTLAAKRHFASKTRLLGGSGFRVLGF